MKVCSIGVGLIGGSMALALKKHFPKTIVHGLDASKAHVEKAIALGIIESEAKFSDLSNFDLVIISVPVDAIASTAQKVLANIHENALVVDMGSTKAKICEELANHPKRNQFLPAHPIAGTEFSGPSASFADLFEGARMIICEPEATRLDLRKKAYQYFQQLGMELQFMTPKAHDQHLAYVSHLSHVSSFMLGKTVLDLESNEKEIFRLAGSGFASTVRLAKSNPTTWSAIFSENKEEVLTSLRAYQKNLSLFEEVIKNNDVEGLKQLLESTSRIKEIII